MSVYVFVCGTYVFDHVLSFEDGGLKLELIRRHTQIPTTRTDTQIDRGG